MSEPVYEVKIQAMAGFSSPNVTLVVTTSDGWSRLVRAESEGAFKALAGIIPTISVVFDAANQDQIQKSWSDDGETYEPGQYGHADGSARINEAELNALLTLRQGGLTFPVIS